MGWEAKINNSKIGMAAYNNGYMQPKGTTQNKKLQL